MFEILSNPKTFSARRNPIPLSKYATLPPLGVVPFVIKDDMFDRDDIDHELGIFS